MRIAIFSDNFYPELSGIADSIITTAEELAKLGHEVRFFVPEYSKKDFQTAGINSKREIDLDSGIEISRFFSFSYPAPTKQGRMVIPTGLRWIKVKKFKPDVIHSHLFFGVGLEAMLAAKILGVPFVGTNHTAITEFVKYAPVKGDWVEKLSLKYVNWFYGKCALTTAPSKSVFDEMVQAGFAGRREVVSNPVNTEAFNVSRDEDRKRIKEKLGLNDKTVVYVGRFAPEKNIDVIVRAVALAKAKIPDIMLAMAGHGAFRPEIEKLVRELKIEKNVKFLGTLSRFEVGDLYRASEIFAITSTSETQSMTLIQAMACGLPTIGVRARALPEYIEGNGILIEPGDAKALSEKMVELLENPTLRNELSKRSLAFVEKFSDKNIALLWEKIYLREINNFKAKI
ncbi:MAG: glycosyltransferase [Candidatus Moranbacteria bacterium]|nr:glycosyltransferase [Candidatus Moranbacteria bacterium]